MKWSARVVVRYAVLQLPAVVLLVLILTLVRRWADIPAWFVWGLVGLWVVKDVIMFPFVWRAYDTDRTRTANSMVGSRGIAKDRLAPSGYIRVCSELWRAEVMGGDPPIERGQRVRVRGICGLKLLVQPDDAGTD
jgi:membrane protein implicated in regulation of membrane protease activity